MPPVLELDNSFPSRCAVLAEIRKNHADWNYSLEHGYIRYWRSINGELKRVYEHQLVADHVFGIISNRNLHVHHINGQRTDNRAENLELIANSRHQHQHRGYRQEYLVICKTCGRMFTGDDTRKYCSVDCQRTDHVSSVKPSKKRLSQLLSEVPNWSAIGRILNVSDNTIRKWAKSYNLNVSQVDGRKSG